MSDELKALADLSLGDEAKGLLSDAAEVTENAERMLSSSDALERIDAEDIGPAEPVTDQSGHRS